MMRTFMALLPLADLPKPGTLARTPAKEDDKPPAKKKKTEEDWEHEKEGLQIRTPGLHYNIEIHLPATKDVEVYNAIFKSLREHILGK